MTHSFGDTYGERSALSQKGDIQVRQTINYKNIEDMKKKSALRNKNIMLYY